MGHHPTGPNERVCESSLCLLSEVKRELGDWTMVEAWRKPVSVKNLRLWRQQAALACDWASKSPAALLESPFSRAGGCWPSCAILNDGIPSIVVLLTAGIATFHVHVESNVNVRYVSRCACLCCVYVCARMHALVYVYNDASSHTNDTYRLCTRIAFEFMWHRLKIRSS